MLFRSQYMAQYIKSISDLVLFFDCWKNEFLFHEIIFLKIEASTTLSQRINEFTEFSGGNKVG